MEEGFVGGFHGGPFRVGKSNFFFFLLTERIKSGGIHNEVVASEEMGTFLEGTWKGKGGGAAPPLSPYVFLTVHLGLKWGYGAS